MRSPSQPLIAVDVGLLAGNAGGLSRYLRELLPVLVRLSAGHCRWALYGRSGRNLPAELLGSSELREDRLPSELGRIVSLFTTMPYWAWRDMPDIFWGPAHRLPVWLPSRTRKVVTIHDLCWLVAPETMRPLTRALDAWLMPRALDISHRVIAVSNATREMLSGHFPGCAHKVTVVHEGVSPLPAPLPIEWLAGRGITAPYILFVGTREPRKNLGSPAKSFCASGSWPVASSERVQDSPAGPGWCCGLGRASDRCRNLQPWAEYPCACLGQGNRRRAFYLVRACCFAWRCPRSTKVLDCRWSRPWHMERPCSHPMSHPCRRWQVPQEYWWTRSTLSP